MKRLISIMFISILLITMISGCGSKPAAEQSSGGTAETKAAEDTEKAVKNAMETMETLMNKEWPKDKVPAELPEYEEGEIVNSGGDGEDFYIKIDKTNEDALNKYLDNLKSLGWNVESGKQPEARKGIYSIRFSWQGDEHLQMAIYTGKTGIWPKDQLPPDVVPPPDCTFIGEMELLETVTGQVWYMNYECEGINEEKANAYIDTLIKDGWSGDASMITKTVEWKGKKYEASIEVYEINNISATFTLNLMLLN